MSEQKYFVKVGEVYGNLTITDIQKIHNGKRNVVWAICECTCGTEGVRRRPHVLVNVKHPPSCGCTRHKYKKTIDGISSHRLYRVWRCMIQRCHDPANQAYKNYGGRGIYVCDEWRNDCRAFYEWGLANGHADDLEIDRRDNNHGYSPDNCRFVTREVNANNTRSNHYITAFGQTLTLAEWAKTDKAKVKRGVIGRRIQDGWTPEAAISTPPQKSKGKEGPPLYAFGQWKCLAAWVNDDRCIVKSAGLRKRLKRGMSLEEAMTTPSEWDGRRQYEYDGESKTLYQWALDSRVNLPETTLSSRITNGWPLEKALFTKPQKRKNSSE